MFESSCAAMARLRSQRTALIDGAGVATPIDRAVFTPLNSQTGRFPFFLTRRLRFGLYRRYSYRSD